MTEPVIAPVSAAPHDLDLERALLASVIADNAMLDTVASVEPEMLYDPIHAAILAAAFDLRQAGRPVNLVTLKPRFGAVPFTDGGTVFDYLKTFEFAGNLPKLSDVVGSIVELHLRRDMQALGERLSGAVWDAGIGPETILGDVSAEVSTLLARTAPQGTTRANAARALDDLFDSMLNDDATMRIPSGLADLDNVLGGFRRGDYVILAGRPSMGKSAVAVSIARRVAKAGYGVAIYSLEMSYRHWMARTVCDEAWDRVHPIAYSDVLKNSLEDKAFDRFVQAAKRVRELPMIINQKSGLSAAEILIDARQVAQLFANEGKKLGLVIVDHMGKVRPSNRYKGNPVKEMGEVSESMSHLGKSMNVAVLALAQLNRGVESRENKRPTLADLRQSGDLEQDADVVLFPYRPAYYLERSRDDDVEKEDERQRQLEQLRNALEITVAKQRNGATTTVDLFVDIAANAVRDASRFEGPPRFAEAS